MQLLLLKYTLYFYSFFFKMNYYYLLILLNIYYNIILLKMIDKNKNDKILNIQLCTNTIMYSL